MLPRLWVSQKVIVWATKSDSEQHMLSFPGRLESTWKRFQQEKLFNGNAEACLMVFRFYKAAPNKMRMELHPPNIQIYPLLLGERIHDMNSSRFWQDNEQDTLTCLTKRRCSATDVVLRNEDCRILSTVNFLKWDITHGLFGLARLHKYINVYENSHF